MEYLKNKIATYLAEESRQDEEVLLFGLSIFFSTLLGYVSLFIVTALLGIFSSTLPAAITASIFRIFSGGAHASSPIRCSFIGVVVFSTLGFIAKAYSDLPHDLLVYSIIVTTVVGLFIFYEYVPAETPGKPISSKIQRKYLRIFSFSLIIIWCCTLVLLLVFPTNLLNTQIIFSSLLGMIWQLLTITPLGFKFVDSFNTTLKNFKVGGV